MIVRTSWLYGENGKSFVKAILEKAKKSKVLKVVNDQVGSPTYTKDLAVALNALLNARCNRRDVIHDIFHISNKGEVSRFDYAKKILETAGLKEVKLEPVKSSELNCRVKRPAFSVLDNTKFEKLTGHRMRPWKNALMEYMNEKI